MSLEFNNEQASAQVRRCLEGVQTTVTNWLNTLPPEQSDDWYEDQSRNVNNAFWHLQQTEFFLRRAFFNDLTLAPPTTELKTPKPKRKQKPNEEPTSGE